jgi:hypothetical protein
MMLRRARRSAALFLAVSLAVAGLAPAGLVPAVLAAEYEMDTMATYRVEPDERRVLVDVEVAFTNTTPDPDGQFSVFEEIKLAIHDDATEVSASDEEGELEVAVEIESDVRVASVQLREDLRYEETAELTVSWTLPDSEDPQLRVRPSLVIFPAWGFGTSAEVQVVVPSGYEVRVDGDSLTVSDDGALVSGEIEDPTQWLALVTAIQPAEYTDVETSIPLEGGTADLRVRAFADDEAWAERIRSLLEDALPRLEEAIGLPYPRIGQLVITEAATGTPDGFGTEPTNGTEIVIAFDQPDFTVLHQVAHVWISPELVEARWIREGLASHFAAAVAEPMEVSLPYAPGERAAERAEAAFPLDSWSSDAGTDGEAYGYAASWAFVDELARAVGADAVTAVLGRVRASVGPYQSADVDVEPVNGEDVPATPLTTRAFLDHLETVTGERLDQAFAETVLTEADVALLPARAAARDAFDALVEAGGSWPAPDPVLGAMTAWEFAEAQRLIDEAAGWLERRDALLERMSSAGLSAPERLRQAYRSYGGGPEAVDELEAEQAVVEAYTETAAEVNAEHSFLERVGLIGGEDPAMQLNLANGRFAEGDLRGALEAVTEAQRILNAAETGGIVRIASALLVAVFLLGLAVLLVRRRASYTPRP